MKVKEVSNKAHLKLNTQKTKIMESDPIPSGQTDGKQWKQWQTLFWEVSKILADCEGSHEIKRHLFLGRKVMTNLSGGSELKCLPEMPETWVRSLGREDPLEKEMATHSSILACRVPWMGELGGLQSVGSQRVRHDWATSFLGLLR